jgi:hypothetical protein
VRWYELPFDWIRNAVRREWSAPVAAIVAGIGLRTAACGQGVTVLGTPMPLAVVVAELRIRKEFRSNGDWGLVIRWRLRRRTHGDGPGGCIR